MSPDISVVLCTWNRAPLLRAALAALRDQRTNVAFELIVVDNASTDGTPELLRQLADQTPHLRVIHEGRQGLSFARNSGIAAARAPLIAFTDDDVRVGTGWIEAIAEIGRAHV